MIKKPSHDVVVQTEVCGSAKRHSAVNLQLYEQIRQRVFDLCNVFCIEHATKCPQPRATPKST